MATGAVGLARPRDRDELLAQVGPHKESIYSMVRTILDDLEAVAPWDGLYYPPTGTAEFLGMETALVGMIQDIPQRVAALTRELSRAELDDATREIADNMEFYFQGIQVSVASELEKLSAKLTELEAGAAERPLSFFERAFICEISADLKGKYTSSIMGAAASLIAEGLWTGVEIEPILFPEKAEEFDRNERLVEALSEVTETIGNFLDEVPLVSVIDSWRQRRRVDQYALAPFYMLLGNLGRLMQVSSRRALYSGDYHQIQQRESQLSSRINRLLTLHNKTWLPDTHSTGEVKLTSFEAMVQTAAELATILDVEILRKIIGQDQVKELHFIVTMEKEDETAGRPPTARRDRLPKAMRDLVPLLYDEDLKTFLELLLGSVLKRASLAIKRETQVPVPELADLTDEPPAELLPAVEPAAHAEAPASDPLAEDPFLADMALEAPALDDLLEPPGLESPTGQGGQAPALETPSFDAPALEAPTLEDFSLPELPEVNLAPSAGTASPALEPPGLDEPGAGLMLDGELLMPQSSDAGFSDASAADSGLYPESFEALTPPGEAAAAQPELGLPSAGPGYASGVDPSLDETAMSMRSSEPNPMATRLDALQSLNLVLQPLLSRSSSQRKSFELVRRLLKQRRNIPDGLLQSMRPYLHEISSELIPRLRREPALEDMMVSYGAELSEHCQILCDPVVSPETAGVDLPASMEQVLDLLNHLAIATRSSIERLSTEIERPPEADPLGW
ncbi:MAG: hypothetical protein AAF560_17685 [Acidobacteriota bacterium]